MHEGFIAECEALTAEGEAFYLRYMSQRRYNAVVAELVRVLDMSRLVHNGSKSLTTRILGRVKGNLEEFVAPQAPFAFVWIYACCDT